MYWIHKNPKIGLLISGGMVASKYANHPDDRAPRNYEKPPDQRHAQRSSELVSSHQGGQTNGRWWLYVPNQYGPDEKSSSLSTSRRWVMQHFAVYFTPRKKLVRIWCWNGWRNSVWDHKFCNLNENDFLLSLNHFSN